MAGQARQTEGVLVAKRLSALYSGGHRTEGDWTFLMDVAKAAHDARRCQKAYFKSRLQADLVASKEAEAKLDRLLNEEGPEPEQHDLPAVRVMEAGGVGQEEAGGRG